MEGVTAVPVDTLTFPPAKPTRRGDDPGVGVLEPRRARPLERSNGQRQRPDVSASRACLLRRSNVPISEVGTMRYVQDYFLSGGTLRVYRDWPAP